MKQTCQGCKKEVDKLYEHKGWEICWDCYWADVDKEKEKKT